MADRGVESAGRSHRLLLAAAAPVLIGAAVAIGLGVYGHVHDPTGRSLPTLFFTDTIRLKTWLGTGCLVLVGAQLVTAARLHGWVRRSPRSTWLADLHRLVGTLAFALSLPVAYHCLWALGYQTTSTRVALHSLLGCAFYGAFTAKMIFVRRPDGPGWTVPFAGAATSVIVVAIWWTSSLWFFRTVTWAP